jgi:hypothetical protein
MGQLISRPIERMMAKVLDEALEPIKKDLTAVQKDLTAVQTGLTAVQTGLKTLTDAILVPEGDKLSKKIAVSIKDSSSSGSTSGHGAVVCIAEFFYLLSAAHVLVDFSMDFTTSEEARQKIIYLERAGKKFSCTSTGHLYVHSDYVSNGSKDVGFLGISFDPTNSEQQELIDAEWAEAKVGKSVVASGLVHLLGIVTSFTDGRFSVLAHSVPGQSGSLVLDSTPALTGVVHGSSKHRGKHSGDTFRDDASVVYCDAVVLEQLIHIDNNTHLLWLLQLAEDIPEDIASGSRKPSDCPEECGFRKLVCELYPEQPAAEMKDLTLAAVMGKLREQMPAPNVTFSNADVKLCVWKE